MRRLRPSSAGVGQWCNLRLTVLAVAVLAVGVAGATGQGALRYRLSAGDLLVYDRQETTDGLSESEKPVVRRQRIQIWCLERGPGDECLLLVELAEVTPAGAQPARGLVLYIDGAGGRRLPPESAVRVPPLAAALDVLPMLPRTAQSGSTWVSSADTRGRRQRCTIRGNEGRGLRVDFTSEDSPEVAAVLKCSRSGSFWFDSANGRVARIEIEEIDSRTGVRKRAEVTLRQAETHSPRWAARRAAEVERYRDTLRHEDRLLHALVNQPKDFMHSLEQLDRIWSALRSDVDVRGGSPIARLALDRRRLLRAEMPQLQALVALGKRWVNRPARPWTLQDAAGRTITCEEARQGVMIELFWTSDDAWGLRALDCLRRLPIARPPNPVQLLCYCMDNDVEAAKTAIERCPGELKHVLAGPLQYVEPLPMLPIVRVLDQDAVVREVWLGWRPNYEVVLEAARKLARQAAE